MHYVKGLDEEGVSMFSHNTQVNIQWIRRYIGLKGKAYIKLPF